MDILPDSNEQYESKTYWQGSSLSQANWLFLTFVLLECDTSLSKNSEAPNASFDWFKSYSQISDLLSPILKPEHRILILGCGNSTLSEEMYDAGYKNIVNIDVWKENYLRDLLSNLTFSSQFSPVVIEKMRARHSDERPQMEWLEMDIRALAFDDSSFDIAIDKGTMDAMMAVKGDVWNPPPQVIKNCNKEIDEVIRVLRPKGHFVYLTFGQPHFRKRYLQCPGTTLKITELGDAFHYYLYVMTLNSEDDIQQ